jgi:hypothetical protein
MWIDKLGEKVSSNIHCRHPSSKLRELTLEGRQKKEEEFRTHRCSSCGPPSLSLCNSSPSAVPHRSGAEARHRRPPRQDPEAKDELPPAAMRVPLGLESSAARARLRVRRLGLVWGQDGIEFMVGRWGGDLNMSKDDSWWAGLGWNYIWWAIFRSRVNPRVRNKIRTQTWFCASRVQVQPAGEKMQLNPHPLNAKPTGDPKPEPELTSLELGISSL